MKWVLAGVLAALVAGTCPSTVDACGIKLVIKTSTPRKAVARSSNPSHVLLLGTPPHRLERELAAAGHDVEVESTPAEAKRTAYEIVVVDQKGADDARARFPNAQVVVRSGDVTGDIAQVETRVSRKPVGARDNGDVVRAREARQPVAAGPTREKGPTIVAAKAATEPTAAKEETPPPPKPAAKAVKETPPPKEEPVKETQTPPAPPVKVAKETPPAKETPAPPPPKAKKEAPPPKEIQTAHEAPAHETAPPPVAASGGNGHEEIYFSYASANVDKMAILRREVKWLSDHSTVNVTVEGYADPTGNHDSNMTLSQARADAVKDFLVSNGVDASRIEVQAFGDTKLKYGRSDGRNRRVAIEPKP